MKKQVERIQELLEANRLEEIKALLESIHPADVADLLEQLPRDKKDDVFNLLGTPEASEVILELDEESKEAVLEQATPGSIQALTEEMESDDAADFIADLPEPVREKVLTGIPLAESEEVKKLLAYPETSAGGIMQTEMARCYEENTAGQAINLIRILARDKHVEDVHNVFVVNYSHVLVGTLPVRKLVLYPKETLIRDIMDPEPVSVNVLEDQEEVARIFQRYDIISLPVVDSGGKLIGQILIDDVVDVIEEETSEDMMKIAGTHNEELLFTRSVFRVARFRLPWLVSSVLGGLFTGILIWRFKVTLEEAITLAAFIPVVMGVGGNVATQSSAIVVRGLATGRIHIEMLSRFVLKETAIGLILGVICGGISGSLAGVWHGNQALGMVVAGSMFLGVLAAGMMGILIPLFFQKIDVDPAIAAGPIVLTLNDISGLLIFLTISTAWLEFLR
jgi:magnesium transporter